MTNPGRDSAKNCQPPILPVTGQMSKSVVDGDILAKHQGIHCSSLKTKTFSHSFVCVLGYQKL
jgi:hypothetical protein